MIFQIVIFEKADAEIIKTSQEEQTFGEWKVFCEIDDMMKTAHCKIASKFYDNSSVISLQPTNNFVNEFLIIIPKIKLKTFAQIRVDDNDLILSQNVESKDFGLLKILENQKNILYLQMKNGDYLFLRFSINDSDKEITVKLNLKNFADALNYYYKKTNYK